MLGDQVESLGVEVDQDAASVARFVACPRSGW